MKKLTVVVDCGFDLARGPCSRRRSTVSALWESNFDERHIRSLSSILSNEEMRKLITGYESRWELGNDHGVYETRCQQ